jgi:hypothetical protein
LSATATWRSAIDRVGGASERVRVSREDRAARRQAPWATDPKIGATGGRRRLVADLHVAVAVDVHDYVHADDQVDVIGSPRS